MMTFPRTLLMNPAFQVILSGHRVDLFQNRERLINDLIREFPGQEREINRFYQAVSKAGRLVERWIAEDETGRPGVIRGYSPPTGAPSRRDCGSFFPGHTGKWKG